MPELNLLYFFYDPPKAVKRILIIAIFTKSCFCEFTSNKTHFVVWFCTYPSFNLSWSYWIMVVIIVQTFLIISSESLCWAQNFNCGDHDKNGGACNDVDNDKFQVSGHITFETVTSFLSDFHHEDREVFIYFHFHHYCHSLWSTKKQDDDWNHVAVVSLQHITKFFLFWYQHY